MSEWFPISTAPMDGTRILAWCVHPHAMYFGGQAKAVAEGYAASVIAHWIDHNGGGWTWHGMNGNFTHWQPLPEPPAEALRASAARIRKLEEALGELLEHSGYTNHDDASLRHEAELGNGFAPVLLRARAALKDEESGR